MKRFWSITLNVLGWAAILAYLVMAGRLCSREQDGVTLRDVEVTVRDSAELGIINPYMVKLWLDRSELNLRNKAIGEINTSRVKDMILGHKFVRSAEVFTDISGVLHIELTQRRPVARVNTANGYGFYIADDGWILPLQGHYTAYVPVVTGIFTPPFPRGYVGHWEGAVAEGEKNVDKNYIFFGKLINFVRFIGGDDFWGSQIVQIDVSGESEGVVQGRREPHVEFVPRAGNHIVSLGTLDNVDDKLDKLMLFYRKGLDYQGWGSVSRIDLSYRNQIVCK